MTTSKQNSQPIDKEFLYGNYFRTERWRDSLQRKLSHKALDIPDDMDVKVSHKTGVTWKELLAIGAIMAGCLFGWNWYNRPSEQPTEAVQQTIAPQRFRVRFSTEDGTTIPIRDPIPAGPTN